MDLPGGPEGLVPVVLPLLLWSPHLRGRCSPDQTMESDAPPHLADSEELRTPRFALPPATTTSASPMGLRQQSNLRQNTLRPRLKWPQGRRNPSATGVRRWSPAATA